MKKENFEQLIEINKNKFYKTAKAILKNEDDVYDVIQEALLTMYTKFDSLNNKKFFTTWGIRIIINKSYDYIRKYKKNISLDENEEGYNLTYKSNELEKIELEDLLNMLDDESKLITTLYYYDDLKIKEIASILNKPEGTIKYNLSEIRKKLRENLEVR